jgi:glycine dehydrogenase subunit 2
MIGKVRSHQVQNEPLLFERSRPGKKATSCRRSTCRRSTRPAALGAEQRARRDRGLPRGQRGGGHPPLHALSTWNYAIDLGLYPLGSCTMKYNPRINELVARIDGLAWAHPYQPEALSQGAMEVMAHARARAGEITGMDAVTLQPAAGAHGELTGILLMRALLGSGATRARRSSCRIRRTAPTRPPRPSRATRWRISSRTSAAWSMWRRWPVLVTKTSPR